MQTVVSVWNPIPVIADIDMHDDGKCVVISTDDNKLTSKMKLKILFSCYLLKEEEDGEWLQSHLQTLQVTLPFPQTPANATQIQINGKWNANFLFKVAGRYHVSCT